MQRQSTSPSRSRHRRFVAETGTYRKHFLAQAGLKMVVYHVLIKDKIKKCICSSIIDFIIFLAKMAKRININKEEQLG